jgi:DNA-binding MarR family transcriptional regulator
VNPDPILQLDRVIHEKGRLAIVSTLMARPGFSFSELRDLLQMTDGNITAHTRTLKQAGYLAVTKSMRNARPLTTFSLTVAGQTAFKRHIGLLEEIVKSSKSRD